MIRFSGQALQRTIANRRADLNVRAVLLPKPADRERASDGAVILDLAGLALSDPKVSKREALLALGLLAKPSLSAGANDALFNLRTAITASRLDSRDDTIYTSGAVQRLASLHADAAKNDPQSIQRIEKAMRCADALVRANVAKVNFVTLWANVDAFLDDLPPTN